MHFFNVEAHFFLQVFQSFALRIIPAGDVGADALLCTAQHSVDGLAGGLAPDIPAGNVYGRQHLGVDAADSKYFDQFFA